MLFVYRRGALAASLRHQCEWPRSSFESVYILSWLGGCGILLLRQRGARELRSMRGLRGLTYEYGNEGALAVLVRAVVVSNLIPAF